MKIIRLMHYVEEDTAHWHSVALEDDYGTVGSACSSSLDEAKGVIRVLLREEMEGKKYKIVSESVYY